MRKLLLSLIWVAGIFLATNVFAVGTPTVRFHEIEVGTLNLGTPTASSIAKLPVMTDNTGSKFDSGALALVSGSQSVTTSLTACDRVLFSITADGTAGNGSETFRVTTSGAGFTIYGYTVATGATSTTSRTGHWMAIDE